MSRPCLAITLGAVLVPATVAAQEFEVILRSREIRVHAEAYLEATATERERIFDVTPADLLAFGAGASATDAGFEVRNFVMSVSGPRVRLESPDGTLFGPGGYVTIDVSRGLYRIVLPANGAYVEWTLDDMARLVPEFTPPDLASPPTGGANTRALNRTRVIDGRTTMGYRIETPDETKVVWLSEELQDLGRVVRGFTLYASRMRFGVDATDGKNDDRMLNEMAALYARGFPTLTASLDEETFSLAEVQTIERTTVDSNLFAPPAGLTRLPLEALLQDGG